MDLSIASSFPAPSEADWRRLVEKALGNRSFESLISTTFEGLEIQPLYLRPEDERARPLRQRHGPWQIAQRIDHPDPETANASVRTDLAGGADGLALVLAPAHTARGFGVNIGSERDLEALLAEVELDLTPLRLDAGPRLADLAPYFAAIARERRLTSAALDVDFGHDPIGQAALSGLLPSPEVENLHKIRTLLRNAGYSGHILLADGRPYHEAGAGEAQELACVIATGVEYLRLLEAENLSLEEAQNEIAFLLPADADEFLSLCKFRALRLLWARVESQCDLKPKPIRLHAETSFRMMTRYDPWLNILRAAMGVFAAAIGGADTITALPFTLALGLPDALARRIARNTQLILIHEAHVAKAADPAAGAGSFEALTDELCARAWALFQTFEAHGGIRAALRAGAPQREIANAAMARREAIAHRTPAITGTSAFPSLTEPPVEVLMPAPARPGDTPQGGDFPGLALQRDAEPYEILRASVEEFVRKSGQRPKVFLLQLEAQHRSSQLMDGAANFFAAAGLEDFRAESVSAQDAAEAFRVSGCRIACLCAPMPVSTAAIVEAAKMLRAAGAARVCLAGRDPNEAASALRAAGITDYIWPHGNAVAILQDATAVVLCKQLD